MDVATTKNQHQSAPFSKKRKRRNDVSKPEDVSSGTAPSAKLRQHLSGPYAPQFASHLPPYGNWIRAQSPYAPPYGKWVRAPPPKSSLYAMRGMAPPPYDPSVPPLMMIPPHVPRSASRTTAPPPYDPSVPPLMMIPPHVPRSASRTTAPPPHVPQPRFASQTTAPPPYVPLLFATVSPKFSPVAQLGRLDSWCNEPFDTIVQYASRDKRRVEASLFKDFQTSEQSNNNVRKVCIRESAIYDWPDKSFGITWVAMHWMDSICVVTRNKDLVHLEQEVMRTVGEIDNEYFLRSFWNAIVSEVEDIEGQFGESCQMFNGSSVKPFGVVCVISGNNEVQKVSSVEYDAEKAIKFLEEEIKTNSDFTFDKTVLTAISAFQHLFLQKFEADEIRVFAWKKVYFLGKELQQEREDPDVEELLASLNGHDNDSDTF